MRLKASIKHYILSDQRVSPDDEILDDCKTVVTLSVVRGMRCCVLTIVGGASLTIRLIYFVFVVEC